jgi:hypothetical protein
MLAPSFAAAMRETTASCRFRLVPSAAPRVESVVDTAAAVPRPRLVLGLLAAVPQPVVEHARRDAQTRREQLASVHRAGPYLALLRPWPQVASCVDVGGEAGVIDQYAVAVQDVRNEVVGEDRQAVEVAELGDPASARSAGAICARL